MEDVDQQRQALIEKSILLLNEMDKERLELFISYLNNESYTQLTPIKLK